MVSELFNSLSEVAHDINNQTDYINEVYVKINEKLKELNIGIEVWTQKAVDMQVGYARLGGKWTLAIRLDHDREYAITDAPRSARIDALDLIPILLDDMYKEAEKLEIKVDQAVEKASDLLKTIL